MKVSGFTFIRNAVKYDYPIVEAITSILPLCDEVVVALGNSDDDTRSLLEGINSDKVKIIDTVWDDTLREGGAVLAAETNKALQAIANDSDWAFYIQGDEVVHEKYLPEIKSSMEKYVSNKQVEGLLFKYLHFYGSYEYVANSRRWYRNEIRIIRNGLNIQSWGDAQGFRVDGRKLSAVPINAYVYHYGWVKPPEVTYQKNVEFQKLWHNDAEVKQWQEKEMSIAGGETYNYESHIDSIALFDGTHPSVMQPRLQHKSWHIELDTKRKNYSPRYRFLHWIEDKTGWRIGEYKNYEIIKGK